MNMITIELPLPDKRLHAHAKGKWQSKSKPTKQLRELAYMQKLMVARNERWERASLHFWFYFPDRIRRDALNAQQSMKPAIDGIVTDGRLLPDDDWTHLESSGATCSVDKERPRTELVFHRLE